MERSVIPKQREEETKDVWPKKRERQNTVRERTEKVEKDGKANLGKKSKRKSQSQRQMGRRREERMTISL